MPLNNILTTSSNKTLKDCPKKFELAYVLGIRQDREAEYFRWGHNWHTAMEMLGQGLGVDATVDAIRANYAVRPDYIDPEAWESEYWSVACCVIAYAEHYKDDGVQVDDTEREFCVPIINPETGHASTKWKLAGKIDKAVTIAGRQLLGEHKTTASDLAPGSDYWRNLRLDSQPSNYIAASRSMGLNLVGVWYDVLRKPAIKPKQIAMKDFASFLTIKKYCGQDFDVDLHRDGSKNIVEVTINGDSATLEQLKTGVTIRETPAMYGARVMQEVSGNPSRYFARYELARTEADLKAAAYELWNVMQSINSMSQSGQWYRNERECLRMGKCEYFDICGNNLDPQHDQLDGYKTVENRHQELALTATTNQGE